MFGDLNIGLGNIYKASNAVSRSISAENFKGLKGEGGKAVHGTGEKASRELGQRWKVSPSIFIDGGQSVNIAEIEESGLIQHIWMTAQQGEWRNLILRIYWDNEENPSVEVPYGDFFCNGWNEFGPVSSIAIAANPGCGFNCYFPMPFRSAARIEMTNISEHGIYLYYQVDYLLTEIEKDAVYFHASFNRSNPVENGIHTVVDNISGKGQYVGTYMAIQVNNNGWWGEGEFKFYMDDDDEFPTICGTGTEDYFGGAWNFEYPKGQYATFSSPYSGLLQVIRPDGLYIANTRFSMYRFHIMDPIYFEKNFKVTVQDLGWRSDGRYLVQKSDISTVAYWYQTEPHQKHPYEMKRNDLEII